MLSTTRRSRRFRLALVVALVVALTVPSGAFAALEDQWTGTSSTNPQVGADSTWRWGWGNTPLVNIEFTLVPDDDAPDLLGQTDGFIYELHQADESANGTVTPVWSSATTWLSPMKTGPSLDFSLNLSALNAREPWVPLQGANATGEGAYWLSWLWYNQYRVEREDSLNTLPLGYDITPPSAVQDLTSTVDAFGQASGWTEESWRDLRWSPQAYDALSGVGGFEVSIDSSSVAFAKNSMPDPAYEPYARMFTDWVGRPVDYRGQLSNVTIEDVPDGKHILGITTIDRATNRSQTATVAAWVDSDTPDLVVLNPSPNEVIGKRPAFSVEASDGAGISAVKYYVDNILVGTSTKAPFGLTADLSGFAGGTHTLKVEAYDMIGGAPGSWRTPHVNTQTVGFKLDRTAPTVSFISGAPNPFYPRKRDGYKDNFVVKFKASEAGAAKLTIKNSKGSTIRTVTKSIGSGTNTISWNGKYTGGTVNSGTFSYRVSMTDKAGNVSSSTASRKVTIKFYELVKTSSNTIQVISR